MDQVVQAYVSDKKFMGSVLVARGDGVLMSKSYGSANLEWNIPNSPNTKFRLGSITFLHELPDSRGYDLFAGYETALSKSSRG